MINFPATFSGPKVCVLSDQWAASFQDSNASWTGNEVRLIQKKLTVKSRMLKPSPSSPFSRSISEISDSQNPVPGTGESALALESVAKESRAESGLWMYMGSMKVVLGGVVM